MSILRQIIIFWSCIFFYPMIFLNHSLQTYPISNVHRFVSLPVKQLTNLLHQSVFEKQLNSLQIDTILFYKVTLNMKEIDNYHIYVIGNVLFFVNKHISPITTGYNYWQGYCRNLFCEIKGRNYAIHTKMSRRRRWKKNRVRGGRLQVRKMKFECKIFLSWNVIFALTDCSLKVVNFW